MSDSKISLPSFLLWLCFTFVQYILFWCSSFLILFCYLLCPFLRFFLVTCEIPEMFVTFPECWFKGSASLSPSFYVLWSRIKLGLNFPVNFQHDIFSGQKGKYCPKTVPPAASLCVLTSMVAASGSSASIAIGMEFWHPARYDLHILSPSLWSPRWQSLEQLRPIL